MTILRTTAAAALLLATAQAQAFDWGGYFRAGPGATSEKGVSRACYGLSGPGLKYRLGNECDIYGEFTLGHDAKVEGIDVRGVLMTNFYNNATDSGDEDLGIEQMYAEIKGVDISPTTVFWIGKERGRRGDVHIVDTFFTEMKGVGAGAKEIGLGPGKLGVAYYKTDGDEVNAGHRLNAEFYDWGVNPDGKLSLIGTLTKATEGAKGGALSVRHVQDGVLGGANSLWLQYAQGTAALNSNFGDLLADRRTKAWRVVESIHWQQGNFGGQAIALWSQQQAPDAVTGDSVKTTSMSLGGRVSYAVTKNFKLLGELGLSQVKPEGQDTQRLTKFTFAPTLATGPGFWNRPELRLYVTHAKWSGVNGAVVTGESAFDGKESGTSYGAQVEIWF
ncbi:MAG TPA: carbohydrate porin [Ideonella sp.]|uniref:maltoporin n=1 Tax=Ideonella sp. TaxID=1929293 RepID=UPI002E308AF1|nr:carbohydrate porin [Ideonella sp.]HEX5684619.1 carbohydrate porin [Ideonella sp.]